MAEQSFERKKMTIVYILEILKRYTDDTYDREGRPAHCLTQAQIGEKLYKDYDIVLDRKAISRNLMDLTESSEYCDKIIFDTETRNTPVKGKIETSEIRTNYRYCHDFDSAQIRLLMDAVLFSKNISSSECRGLLEQISKLGNIDSRSRLAKHLYKLSFISEDKVANSQLLYNIEIIDEAIEKKRQVAYIYNNYGKDKKLHPRLDAEGNSVIRIVNPYSIQASNGRYYLVCNYDEYDNATNVRIDKITDIEILDTPAKPKNQVKGLRDIPSTLAEQLYMQPGSPERIVFRATNNESIISDMIDWFGKGIRFTGGDDSTVTCEIKSNPRAMRFWAMQYSDHVEILEPERLREEIRSSMRQAWRKYNNGNDSLVESPEGIRKLISDWKSICGKAVSKKEEERKVDIRELGNLVRKTHIILLPYSGRDMEGQYAELMLSLKQLERKTNVSLLPDAYCISLILKGLISKSENAEIHTKRGVPEDILPIKTVIHGDGPVYINLDVSNFEEGYLSLLQYTGKQAEETKRTHAEIREKIREKHKEISEQKR